MSNFFEAIADLSQQKKRIVFLCVLIINLFLSYLLLHSVNMQYVKLKNIKPPGKFKTLECVPLSSFSLMTLTRKSGMQKISLKNPTDEGDNVCAINLSGEGSFETVCQFLSHLNCNQLQFLELTQKTISMVIYGFCTCNYS